MFKKKETPNQARRRPTGTSPSGSAVFSYHANRSVLAKGTQNRTNEAARLAMAARQSKRLSWLKRGPVLAGLVLLGLLTIANLFLGSQVKVVSIGDAKGQIFLRSTQTYSDAANDILGNSVFNKTKLTISTEGVAKALRARFPELESVTVGIPFFGQQPVVYIQPASPKLLLSTLSDGVFVVDATGRALIPAAQVAHLDKLGLPVVTDQSGLSVKAGESVLPSSSVSFITEVVEQLRRKDISVTSLILPAGTSELDAKVNGVAYTVKFNLMGNARVEAGAFLAVKQQLEREHKTPGQYIDVRVDDRAYYR